MTQARPGEVPRGLPVLHGHCQPVVLLGRVVEPVLRLLQPFKRGRHELGRAHGRGHHRLRTGHGAHRHRAAVPGIRPASKLLALVRACVRACVRAVVVSPRAPRPDT